MTYRSTAPSVIWKCLPIGNGLVVSKLRPKLGFDKRYQVVILIAAGQIRHGPVCAPRPGQHLCDRQWPAVIRQQLGQRSSGRVRTRQDKSQPIRRHIFQVTRMPLRNRTQQPPTLAHHHELSCVAYSHCGLRYQSRRNYDQVALQTHRPRAHAQPDARQLRQDPSAASPTPRRSSAGPPSGRKSSLCFSM